MYVAAKKLNVIGRKNINKNEEKGKESPNYFIHLKSSITLFVVMIISVICILQGMIQFFPYSNAHFDASQFLNITDKMNIGLYNKCYMCLGRNKGIGCSCEADCMKTKTCCIDAFWNSTYILQQEKYIKDFLALSKQHKDPECMPLLPRTFFEGVISSYYMVTSCQESRFSVSKELEMKCIMGSKTGNALDYYIPVKGNDNLYRNQYCAICNSVSEFEIVQIYKGCMLPFKICGITLDRRDKNFTLCKHGKKEINKTCSRNYKFYDLCRSFTGPMGKYANYFCHLCNHGYNSAKITTVACIDPYGLISWDSLLKFVFSDKVDSECTNGRVKNEKNLCISFDCPDGYQAKHTKCVASKVGTSKRINVKDASFDKCMFAGNPNIIIRNTLGNQELIKKIFSAYKIDLSNISFQKINHMYFINGSLIQNFSFKIDALNTKKVMYMLNINGSVSFTQANLYSVVNNELSMKQSFPRNLICAYPVPVLLKSLKFIQNCNAMVRKKLISFSNLSLHIIIDKNGLTREAYSCNRFYLSKPCQRKVLNRNDTSRNDTKLLLKKDGTTRIFELHEYAPYKYGGYTVCIDKGKYNHEPAWLSTIDNASAYLSIAGSSLSVFCYLFLIVTILQFEELRNISGLCTLALSINLLIGDGLFLTTNLMQLSEKYKNIPYLCDIIGISIHFFQLSIQMWGLVMALDISVNLPKMNILRQNGKHRFIWYNIAPILFGATLVMIALLFRANNIIDVSYNKGGICILHGFYSRIFLYFLPLMICFLLSTVSLAISLSCIVKERRKRKHVLKGSTKNNTSMIKVGLKLVILCGLTEGIGIIYIPTKQDTPEEIFIINSIFMMLYSLFKAFRGVMIFIVYICRQQVYVMYNLRYGKKDVKDKDETSNGAATTRI